MRIAIIGAIVQAFYLVSFPIPSFAAGQQVYAGLPADPALRSAILKAATAEESGLSYPPKVTQTVVGPLYAIGTWEYPGEDQRQALLSRRSSHWLLIDVTCGTYSLARLRVLGVSDSTARQLYRGMYPADRALIQPAIDCVPFVNTQVLIR